MAAHAKLDKRGNALPNTRWSCDSSAVTRLLGWGLVAAVLGGVTAAVLMAGGDMSLAGPSVLGRSATVVGGAALLLVPAVSPSGAPGRLLLAAAGGAWLLAEWANPSAPGPVAFTIGLLSLGAALPLVLAGGLPRLPVTARALTGTAVGVAVLGALLLGAGPAVVGDPRMTGCPDCPRDLMAAAGDARTVSWLLRAGAAAALAAGTLAVISVVAASVAASRRAGRLDPSGIAGLPTALVAGASAGEAVVLLVQGQGQPAGFDLHAVTSVGLLLVSAAMIRPAIRARLALRAVVRAVAAHDLEGAPRTVEQTLRGALGDPRLRVAYPVDGRWLDVSTRSVEVPRDGCTMVTDAGETLAALVHADPRAAHPSVVAAALAGARLQLDVERIQTGETQRVVELQEARRRAAEAADAARVRLESDLHDGAQQRLVALRYALGVARSRADRLGIPAIAAVLADADAATEQAVTELRDLAHGIGGSTLESLGLAEAVRAATERTGACFAVSGGSVRDVPPVVARAAYAVVAEGLAAADHAGARRVDIGLRRGTADLVVTVTCALSDASEAALEPSPLLEDRIALLGGTLAATTSDRPTARHSELRAELPCE